jgi:hypothetical protein
LQPIKVSQMGISSRRIAPNLLVQSGNCEGLDSGRGKTRFSFVRRLGPLERSPKGDLFAAGKRINNGGLLMFA